MPGNTEVHLTSWQPKAPEWVPVEEGRALLPTARPGSLMLLGRVLIPFAARSQFENADAS